jgi:hypothetical protein
MQPLSSEAKSAVSTKEATLADEVTKAFKELVKPISSEETKNL